MAGINPKTQQELEVIQSYGGELLFTPGDIVYSSSHLIENDPPNIALEKFLLLMEADGLDFDRLRRIVETCEGKRVHVVGDIIVDSLTYTTMIGGMTKTPTPSVRFDNRTDFVGGAGIVAKHLKSAGAEVTLSTVLGDDALAEFALEGSRKRGRQYHADHRSSAPHDEQECVCVRRLSSAQGRYARQPQHHRQAGRNDCRADRERARRGGRVQRFSPWYLQPTHDSRADGRHSQGRVPGRRQPGREPLGQYSGIQGLRPY